MVHINLSFSKRELEQLKGFLIGENSKLDLLDIYLNFKGPMKKADKLLDSLVSLGIIPVDNDISISPQSYNQTAPETAL